MVFEIGRHRVRVWVGHFNWGIRRQAPGAWDGGFGIFAFTYLRRRR